MGVPAMATKCSSRYARRLIAKTDYVGRLAVIGSSPQRTDVCASCVDHLLISIVDPLEHGCRLAAHAVPGGVSAVRSVDVEMFAPQETTASV
jgi:hypothetical protein